MRLIEPITGGVVETATDEATAFLLARGYKKVEVKPRKTARKRTPRQKEQ